MGDTRDGIVIGVGVEPGNFLGEVSDDLVSGEGQLTEVGVELVYAAELEFALDFFVEGERVGSVKGAHLVERSSDRVRNGITKEEVRMGERALVVGVDA